MPEGSIARFLRSPHSRCARISYRPRRRRPDSRGTIITLRDRYLAHARGERLEPVFELLRPLGWTWAGITRLRNHLYDRRTLAGPDPGLPVIAVGNLTVGGTGKTPWVSFLIDLLGRPDRPLGVLTRGYGGRNSPRLWRSMDRGPGGQDQQELADEPRLLGTRHPQLWIAIDPDRVRGVRELRSRGVRLAIADDAFQHRRLVRAADILLIDARRPFGNGRVLPAGTLREPIDGARRAHLIVITRVAEASPGALTALRAQLAAWVTADAVFVSDLVASSWWELSGPDAWPAGAVQRDPPKPGPVLALSAIGNPDSFHRTLEAAGMALAERRVYRDHHRFTSAEMGLVNQSAEAVGAHWIACTEKDLFNLPGKWRPSVPLLVPRLQVRVDRPVDLRDRLEALVKDALATAEEASANP